MNLIEKLTNSLMDWCRKKGRVFNITGTGGAEDIYLIRYYVVQTRFFNFFIHQFLRSDRDDLHDHPWFFATYLVRGAYTETKYNQVLKKSEITRRINVPCMFNRECDEHNVKLNTWVFRKATDQHKVTVDEDLKFAERDRAALTLCFTGPVIRDWGFIKDNGFERKWIFWKKYLGLPDDAPGRG